MEALPVFEPQFAELFNRLAAEIRPLLAAIENFRSECPNYVMAGYQANRYNQADILADSAGSDAFRAASLLSADL